MKRWFTLTSCAALSIGTILIACTACATDAPLIVRPENLKWFSPPGNPALQGAWVIGSEQSRGAYVLRVNLAAGGRIPPHIHPDERNTTVLSGTLYVGFGNSFDEAKMMAIPTGGVYLAPAHVAHYVWAKEGDVIYQEAGSGPTATTPVKP
jgi:quercetin dioxygenase-like cupin family protein